MAAAGIIESTTENICIASQLAGVCREVLVIDGDEGQAGDPLYWLDDTQLQAQLSVDRGNMQFAQAKLAQLRTQPRPAQIPVSQPTCMRPKRMSCNDRMLAIA